MTGKKMVVVLEEVIRIPFRKNPESVVHSYTVYTHTRQQAVNAVRRAGHKGKLVEVRM